MSNTLFCRSFACGIPRNFKLIREVWALAFCSLALGPSAAWPAAETVPGPPRNLLVIIADDIGVDQIDIYAAGPTPAATPNIDALAKRGVLFRNTWSNPVCSSTRATILTGRYGFRTGMGFVASQGQSLRDFEFTLPEMLAEHPTHPYASAAFGKWHLHAGSFDEQSNRRPLAGPARAGFDYFYGVFHYIAVAYDQWRILEVKKPKEGPPEIDHQNTSSEYNTSATVDRAAAWIRDQESRRPGDPWFVWLAFNAAHSPFHKPPADLHSVDLSDPAITCSNPYPFIAPLRLVPCYRAMVEAMDTEIGRLLNEELSPESLARTTIVFVSDNGTAKEASTGEFLPMHAKGTPYEGGIRVPLIVSGAGVKPGEGGTPRESEEIVNTSDLYVTLLELAGVDVAETVPSALMLPVERGGDPVPIPVILDSVSLVPILEDRAPSPDSGTAQAGAREFVYAELFGAGHGTRIFPEAQAIRNRQGYKLIRFPNQSQIREHEEFYYLPDDPFERTDLMGPGMRGDHRKIRKELSDLLDQIRRTGWRSRGPVFTPSSPTLQAEEAVPEGS